MPLLSDAGTVLFSLSGTPISGISLHAPQEGKSFFDLTKGPRLVFPSEASLHWKHYCPVKEEI